MCQLHSRLAATSESGAHPHHGGHCGGMQDGHIPTPSQSFTETNRQFWDNAAKSYYAEPWQRKMVEQVSTFVLQNLDVIGVDWVTPGEENEEKKEVRVLDYACGPGTISRILAPYVTHSQGLDISTSMVSEYTRLTTSFIQETSPSGTPLASMTATVGDLLDASTPSPPELKGPQFWNFDLAVVGLGFHHFESPALATQRLVQRLKPGSGVLVIIDFEDDGSSHHHHHGHNHDHDGKGSHHHGHGEDHSGDGYSAEEKEELRVRGVAHPHGFSKEGMKRVFEGAGLVDFGFVVYGEKVAFMPKGRVPVERDLFIARGRKAE